MIREDGSTKSGLLSKQIDPFTQSWGKGGQGQSTIAVYRLRAGDIFQYLLQAISDHVSGSRIHLQN